ncbi:hypothetical protein D3C80_1295340 [compost metagenome]
MDFLIADDATLDAQFASDLLGQCNHVRVILALAAFIEVIAATGFLSETAEAVERIGKFAVAGIMGNDFTARFAHQEADIDARQIVHGDDSHRHAEASEHVVNLRRRGTFQQQTVSLARIRFEHAIADKAEAHPGNHRDLADAFCDFQRRGQDIGGRGRAAHHFEQAHDVGRAEEVQADDVLWPTRDGGNGIDIQGGGIAGENRSDLAHLVQCAKHLLLDR